MASIYRPRGRKLYYIAFRDPSTKRRVVVPGYVDRDATRAKATDLERQAARRAAGIRLKDRCPKPRNEETRDVESRVLVLRR